MRHTTVPAFDSFEADDGVLLRHGVWPGPSSGKRGTVVLMPGRCEFLEKYQETADDLVARGFTVRGLDWRNQGLSGGRPAGNPMKHHVDDFGRLADDFAAFLKREVVPADGCPPVLLAHSMGGLIAVLHLVRHPDLHRAAILSAPMFAIRTAPWPSAMVPILANAACRVGLGRAYAPGQRDYDPARIRPFSPRNKLSGDEIRWRVFHDAFREQPELRVGGVTYGWLRAAWRAFGAVTRTLDLSSVETRVLILSAPRDRVVDSHSHEELARRLPRAAVRRYENARHELLMESDVIRNRVLADIDTFLRDAGV